jgi:anti-anti-sigma factor
MLFKENVMINYTKINNVIVICPGDSLTINDLEGAWRCVEESFSHYPEKIIMDLSSLSSIDSAGIGFLVKLNKKTKIYCFDLLFTGLSDSLKRLFYVTGILSFFNIVSSEEIQSNVFESILY